MDDLQQEQPYRLDWSELPIPPLVPNRATRSLDPRPTQRSRQILLDLPHRRCDSSHPWPPFVLVFITPTITSGGRASRK
jgi:hypothetical protein